MDEQLNKILYDMASKQGAMNDTLIRLTITVEEHVRRSNMMEAALNESKVRVDAHDVLIEKGRGAFWLASILIAGFGIWIKFFKI